MSYKCAKLSAASNRDFMEVFKMILSLQGCMAVGKTTAVTYLKENAPYVNISYEINSDIIQQVKDRKLDKNKYEDYLEIKIVVKQKK